MAPPPIPEPGDWLSRLLDLIPVSGRVDHHCLFGAPWQLDNPAPEAGIIPYHVVISGSATLSEAGSAKEERLVAGDILILPHGSAHILHDGSGAKPASATHRATAAAFTRHENEGTGDRLDMLCGSFLLSPVHERMIRAYFPSRFIVKTANRESATPARLCDLVGLMRSESADDILGAKAMLNALSTALFTFALRLASEDRDAPAGLLALAGNAQLAPALSALFEDPGRPWTLPELAARCNMSRATFIRRFQARLGRSAAEFLTDIRMTIAANQLSSTSASTGAIAETVGYQSEAAFQRAFKARMGLSPARHRRKASLPPPLPVGEF